MPRIRSALSIVCAKDHIYEVSFIHYSASETGEELGKGELVRSSYSWLQNWPPFHTLSFSLRTRGPCLAQPYMANFIYASLRDGR